MRISIIAAIGENNELGKNNDLIWHLPNDLKFFKSVTTGKVKHYTPKTYDKGGWSIPNVVWWLDCDFPKKEKV